MPLGLSDGDVDKLDDLVTTRRKIKRGAGPVLNGDRFNALYAIRTGFFKTCVAAADGRDQVTGFQMAGPGNHPGLTASWATATAATPWRWKTPGCVMPYDRVKNSRAKCQLYKAGTRS